MKVLFISRMYPPAVGGMERFAYELSHAVERQVARLDRVVFGGRVYWQPFIWPYIWGRSLWHVLTRDYDVIHIQDALLAPLGWVLSRLIGKPYVVVVHGLDVTFPNKLYQWSMRPFLRRADQVIANSQATREQALSVGVPQERVVVITLGVRAPRRSRMSRAELMKRLDIVVPDETKLLLSVGRLVERKGVEWFVDRALPGIVADHPETMYMVVGRGYMADAIRRAVVRRQLTNEVVMLGRVPDTIRDALYQHADVFVMPNINVPNDMEGFGLVAVEAAAAGIPVVASRTEGIVDAIQDGRNGQLVAVKDAGGYREAIGNLLTDDETSRRTGRKSAEFTREYYSWRAVAGRFCSVYELLLSKPEPVAQRQIP